MSLARIPEPQGEKSVVPSSKALNHNLLQGHCTTIADPIVVQSIHRIGAVNIDRMGVWNGAVKCTYPVYVRINMFFFVLYVVNKMSLIRGLVEIHTALMAQGEFQPFNSLLVRQIGECRVLFQHWASCPYLTVSVCDWWAAASGSVPPLGNQLFSSVFPQDKCD